MVNVPITADVSAVQQALDRLNDALNRAGQSARALRDIDLSHPEIRDFADDLQTVQSRFDRLVQQGRGEAAAAARQFRASGNVFGPGGLLTGGVADVYPNTTTAARVQAQLQGYLLGGTSLGPQQTQFQAPPPGGGLTLSASNVLSGAMGAASGAMGPVLGMLGIGSLAAMAKTAFDLAQQQGVAVDTLMRRINESGTEFDRFRSAMSDATRGLGITSIAFAGVAQTFQRFSAEGSPSAVIGQTRFAIGAARSFGTDEGTFAAGMGRAQFLGVDPQRFALMISEAVTRGGLTGQAEEVQRELLASLADLNRNLVQGGAINRGMVDIAGLYGAINQGALETNAPGLRGPGAMNVLSTIDRSIQSGGQAGVAGQLLQLQAFNRYGVYSPYEVGGTIEGGMFARIRGGPTVLQAELEEINRRYGQDAQSNPWLYRNVIERTLGLRAPVTAALQAMPEIGQNLEGLYRGRGGGLVDVLAHAGITDLNTINPTSLQDLASIGLGGQDVLAQYRERALKRDDLTEAQRAAITNAGPDDLRDTLLRVYAQAGQEKDDATKLRESMARLTDTLTKVGGDIVHVVQPLADAILALERPLAALDATVTGFGKSLGDKFGTSGVAGELNDQYGFGDFWKNIDQGNIISAFRSLHFGGGGGGGGSIGRATPEQQAALRERLMADPDLHLSLGGASGVVNRLNNESGLSPGAYNPKEGAHGLAQWRLDRWEELQRKAREWGLDPNSEEAQYRFLKYELQDPKRAALLRYLRKADADPFASAMRFAGPEFENADAGNWAIGARDAPNVARLPSPRMPLPPTAPATPSAGTAAPVTVHIDPLTVNHQINSVDAFSQSLPTFVIPATPNNAPPPLQPPSNTGSQSGSRQTPPPPSAPPPAPPPPSNWWDRLRSLQFDPAAAG